MKELSTQELALVHAGMHIDVNYVIDKTLGFGAMGVLVKAVTISNPTLSILGHAFAIGAAVGAVYSTVRSALSL